MYVMLRRYQYVVADGFQIMKTCFKITIAMEMYNRPPHAEWTQMCLDLQQLEYARLRNALAGDYVVKHKLLKCW